MSTCVWICRGVKVHAETHNFLTLLDLIRYEEYSKAEAAIRERIRDLAEAALWTHVGVRKV